MLIAPRFDYEFSSWLEKKFQDDPEVLVVRDRRVGQRRQRREMRHSDRRSSDRRGLNPGRTGIIIPLKVGGAPSVNSAFRTS
jgi:hypothetical protein